MAAVRFVAHTGAPGTLICACSGMAPRRGRILCRLFYWAAGTGHVPHADRVADCIVVV